LEEGSIALGKNLNINSNAETWVTDEQIVLWVFFAGCCLKSPMTEILSMASEHLKTLG
jgi:hypothetical protein